MYGIFAGSRKSSASPTPFRHAAFLYKLGPLGSRTKRGSRNIAELCIRGSKLCFRSLHLTNVGFELLQPSPESAVGCGMVSRGSFQGFEMNELNLTKPLYALRERFPPQSSNGLVLRSISHVYASVDIPSLLLVPYLRYNKRSMRCPIPSLRFGGV